MSHRHDFSGHPGLSEFERQLQTGVERLRSGQTHFDLGELGNLGELPEEQRKLLLRVLAVGAGLGLGALGLYLGKRAVDGIEQTDLPEMLRELENLPKEIVERIRTGWSGTGRRGQRIIIPDE
jgi:hypothetical protein